MPGDDRLIFRLVMAQQALRTHVRQALLAEDVRVTLAQSGILFLLKQKDGRTMTELSRVLGIDNSTLTGLVDRLEKSGYVARRASAKDRRTFRIQITSQGMAESDKAKAVINRVNDEIKSGLSPVEIEAFKTVLEGLIGKFAKS